MEMEKTTLIRRVVEAAAQAAPADWHHGFELGIRDSVRGAEELAEMIRQQRPVWIRYDPFAYVRHGSFWVDDGSTMGVLHPETPVEVQRAVGILRADEIILFLVLVLAGEVPLSGKKVGQGLTNTCPECGGFLTSFATRQKIHYTCSCGYKESEENLSSLAD